MERRRRFSGCCPAGSRDAKGSLLTKASDNGYYNEMLNVVKTFLGMAWKSNPFLQFVVVTGCLRIAKESIFTGANNFISNSISDVHYQDYFGFTEAEVARLLADAGFPGTFLKRGGAETIKR